MNLLQTARTTPAGHMLDKDQLDCICRADADNDQPCRYVGRPHVIVHAHCTKIGTALSRSGLGDGFKGPSILLPFLGCHDYHDSQCWLCE